MNKKTIITMMLALVTMTGLAQTKTATITGYSPTLKDGTVAVCCINYAAVANDTVRGGHFTITVPVDGFTQSDLMLVGEGCPNSSMTLYLRPDALIQLSGTDCLFPLWKVDSPIAEQQTRNSIVIHIAEVFKEYLQQCVVDASWSKTQHAYSKVLKQTMDVLPSLPVDAASLHELATVALHSQNYETFPYAQQLRELEETTAARAPKGFEQELSGIHTLVYSPHILQVGEEAVDAELFDLQGNKHHLFDAFAHGRYVLIAFWSFGCGVSLSVQPDMNELYRQNSDKLEIVSINLDHLSVWQQNTSEKQMAWKNWNEGKIRRGGIDAHYCDFPATPYFILISPDKRIVWKDMGFDPAWFSGIADIVNGHGH